MELKNPENAHKLKESFFWNRINAISGPDRLTYALKFLL